MPNLIGSWAFVVGVILAVVLGALNLPGQTIPVLLVLLGLVVGFLNITGKEVQPFLVAGTVLVIVSALGANVMNMIPVVGRILQAILIMFVPATVIVALKSVFHMARK